MKRVLQLAGSLVANFSHLQTVQFPLSQHLVGMRGRWGGLVFAWRCMTQLHNARSSQPSGSLCCGRRCHFRKPALSTDKFKLKVISRSQLYIYTLNVSCIILVYYFVPFIVNNRYLLFSVSNGHNSVTVQNRTHVYMNFFHHEDLGNHLLQLCPKVVKQSVCGITSHYLILRCCLPFRVCPKIMPKHIE